MYHYISTIIVANTKFIIGIYNVPVICVKYKIKYVNCLYRLRQKKVQFF